MTAAWTKWRAPSDGMDLWVWHAGRCAMCGRKAGDALVLDHCHSTGLIRGYLCRSCNSCEGWSSESTWDGWRSGENTAAAIGDFGIYTGLYGDTPISPFCVLNYYSPRERREWWRDLLADLRSGGAWPEEAPWTDEARARAGVFAAAERAAADLVFSAQGGAA